MAKGVMIVMSQAIPGQEDEFNDWYDSKHIPELLAVPGVTSAQRFVALPSARGQLPPQGYLAVYELDGDIDEIMGHMRAGAPGRTAPEGLDVAAATNYVYRAMGERVTTVPGLAPASSPFIHSSIAGPPGSTGSE